MIEAIKFMLNDRPVSLEVESDRMLLWVLRTDLNLTGTKYGCGQNLCGACTVLVNTEAVRSCTLPVKEVSGKKVITIEGLAKDSTLHPLQKSFIEHSAFQCGFCTPGMILTAYSFLLKNPDPSASEIVRALDGNLCRCGAHVRVIEAVRTAAKVMRGERKR